MDVQGHDESFKVNKLIREGALYTGLPLTSSLAMLVEGALERFRPHRAITMTASNYPD